MADAADQIVKAISDFIETRMMEGPFTIWLNPSMREWATANRIAARCREAGYEIDIYYTELAGPFGNVQIFPDAYVWPVS